jgi:hypothetical protein
MRDIPFCHHELLVRSTGDLAVVLLESNRVYTVVSAFYSTVFWASGLVNVAG